jgi:hypothetical protein
MIGAGLTAFLLYAAPSFGQDIDELNRRIDILSDELDELKSPDVVYGRRGGPNTTFANRVRVYGYGEMHLNHKPGDQGITSIDNHRFVLGVNAQLASWIYLSAEIDYEHAAQALEFEIGFLDFMLDPTFNARAGVVLIPVGFLNEYHEPPLFWSVERPQLHVNVIPSTWLAGGAGLYGTPIEGLNYRFYVVNSLQSIRTGGPDAAINPCDDGHGAGGNCGRFTGSSGLRGGRLQVDEAIAENWAVTGRLEYSKLYPGLQLGFSFYAGDTTQGLIDEGGFVTLLEGDVRYRWKWFEMNSTVVNVDISDADAINDFNALNGSSEIVADNIFGWNAQVGVHLPQLLGMSTSQDLIPWFLYENYDTHDSVPTNCAVANCVKDPRNDREVFTAGLTYFPVQSVALKTDWQHTKRGDNSSEDLINVGVSYMF